MLLNAESRRTLQNKVEDSDPAARIDSHSGNDKHLDGRNKELLLQGDGKGLLSIASSFVMVVN